MALAAHSYSKSTIYTTAATTFAEFVGVTTDPTDGSVMVGFTTAESKPPLTEGNFAPYPTRPRAPDSVYAVFDPPNNTFAGFHGSQPDGVWDMWGLDNSIKWIKTTDRGLNWTAPVLVEDIDRHTDPSGTGIQVNTDGSSTATNTGHILFSTPYFPQASIKLENGHWLRRVNGEDIKYDPNYPDTAFIERSVDGGLTWQHAGPGGALLALGNPDPTNPTTTCQFSRIRQLSNGWLIATGQDFRGTPGGFSRDFTKPALWISFDNGYTWKNGLILPVIDGIDWDGNGTATVTDATRGITAGTTYTNGGGSTPNSRYPWRFFANEWDVVEKANGDLYCITRAGNGVWDGTAGSQSTAYMAFTLTRDQGNRVFTMASAPTNIFGTTTGGPTHPDLARVKVGNSYIWYFFTRAAAPAPSGFYQSTDEGVSWQVISGISPSLSGSDPYYPRSVVTYDSRGENPIVIVAGHVGADNYPGEVDHSIVAHRFGVSETTTSGSTGSIAEVVPRYGEYDNTAGGAAWSGVGGRGSAASTNLTITKADGTYAAASLTAGAVSSRLIARDFTTSTPDPGQANLSALPDNATITGLSVLIRRSQATSTAGAIKEHELYLMVDGVIGSENKADPSAFLTTTNAFRTAGGSGQLWGFASITGAQLKSAETAVIYVAKNWHASTTVSARVDAIRFAAVEYTLPEAPGVKFVLELDQALPITPIKTANGQTRSTAIGIESDTAHPITGLKLRALGAAPAEADSALPITGTKSQKMEAIVGTAMEQPDYAQPITGMKTRAVAQAVETDTTFVVGRFKVREVFQVVETDAAFSFQGDRKLLVNPAIETDSALGVTRFKGRATSQPSTTDTALAITPSKTAPVGQAVETDVAYRIALKGIDLSLITGRVKARVTEDQLHYRSVVGTPKYTGKVTEL